MAIENIHNLSIQELQDIAIVGGSQYSDKDLLIAWEQYDRLIEDRLLDKADASI